MKKNNNNIVNFTKVLFFFIVSFLFFSTASSQSDVILDCENPISEDMTLVNNGSTTINTSITITCVEITDPECFGTEGLVEFTWESSSNIVSGEFILESISTSGENEYGGIIVFNNGGTVSMNPEPGEYLLKFLDYQNNDIYYVYDASITILSSTYGPIVISQPANIFQPPSPGEVGFFEINEITGGSGNNNYELSVGGNTVNYGPGVPIQVDFIDINEDGWTEDDYVVNITAMDLDSENGCLGGITFSFEIPSPNETQITVFHESCPNAGDGRFEVNILNNLPNGVNNAPPIPYFIWSEFSEFNYLHVGVNDLDLTSNETPNNFDGHGDIEGRPIGVRGNYGLMGPAMDGENYDYAPLFFDLLPTTPDESNEYGPLLLYTLSEPDINMDSVNIIQPLCYEQNGPPQGDPWDSSDDDAAGMISMPISALSGTDNLNLIFGINLNPTYWNFILEENGNEITTIQASDSNSDGIIDGNDQIIFDNLEEGEYEIIIEYPAINLTTTISFYGENPTDTIHSGTISNTIYCSIDGFGPFILTEPDEITFVVSGNDDYLVCSGQENGYANISNAQGGTPFSNNSSLNNPEPASSPFTGYYEITIYNLDVSINSSPSALPAGEYYATLKDANGCESLPQPFSITEPEEIDLNNSSIFSYSVGESPCAGDDSSILSVNFNGTVLGLESPFTYTLIDNDPNGAYNVSIIDPPSTTFANLYPATYSLFIHDSNYNEFDETTLTCSASTQILITEPDSLEITSIDVTNALCDGDSNGSAVVNISGGTPFGDGSYQIDGDLDNLAEGTYSVTVTDANGCTTTGEFTVEDPEELVITSIDVTDASCSGFSDGFAILNIQGGTPFGDGSYQIDGDLNNLAEGTYPVTVTDSNGCATIGQLVVNVPNPINVTIDVTDALCDGDSNGSAIVNVGGGTPFEDGTYQIDGDLDNLAAGTYPVTVTDANGCFVETEFVINEPNLINIDINITDALCNGDSNGSAIINVGGGTPFEDDSYQIDAELDNLEAGTYPVTVTDANGCFMETEFTVEEPQILTIEEIIINNATCDGNSDGSVELSIEGGTPFEDGSYQIDGELDNLAAGTYPVTVTDANGCTTTSEFTIADNDVLLIIDSLTILTHPKCFGEETGVIDITVGGGEVGTYTYVWLNDVGDTLISTENANSSIIDNLSSGNYTVAIEDSLGCITGSSFEIIQPDSIQMSINSISHVECFGYATGLIEVNIQGGTLPYNYNWINEEGDEISFVEDGNYSSINNLLAGTYTLAVTDWSGNTICPTEYFEIEITQPDTLPNINIDSIQVFPIEGEDLCGNMCSGSIDASTSISGGTPPYTFVWTQYTDTSPNGYITLDSNEALVDNLCPGDYSITVFDDNGCSDFSTDIITIDGWVQLETAYTRSNYYDNCDYNISCWNGNDGIITVSANGASPFTYDLSNDFNNIDSNNDGVFNNLNEGTYTVEVTDAVGCTEIIEDIILGAPTSPLIIESIVIDTATFCLNNGQITAQVAGGCGLPYTFSLCESNGNTCEYLVQSNNTIVFDGIGAGSYIFTIADGSLNDNCAVDTLFEIPETEAPDFDIFANPDIEGQIIPNWLQNDTLIAQETTIGTGSCESTISMLSPDGILGNFGGSGNDYEIIWFINNGNDLELLDDEDTPLAEFNNQVNENGEYEPIFAIPVNVQTQGQEFILLYLDLCDGTADGVYSDTTFIEVPLFLLNIEAESSVVEYSSSTDTTAISCFGEEDAFAQIQISGGSADDFNNSSCIDNFGNINFWEVTWFLDNSTSGEIFVLDDFDTEILSGVEFIEEDNLPIFGSDGAIDTYGVQNLAPGFYFAQVQDCLVDGCAMIVEFDLRAQPDAPLFFDFNPDENVSQANCTPQCTEEEQEASACWSIQGGTEPYEINLSLTDPNNPSGAPITIPINGTECAEGLLPGEYEVYITDFNDCPSDTFQFEIYMENLVNEALIEVNTLAYPAGYNISCYGESDGQIESITVYSIEDLDGDGNINTADEGIIDTDDIFGTWTPSELSNEFEIDWGIWNASLLPAGEYTATICSQASDGSGECPTQFTFSIYGPNELYVFVPDYETCRDCPINVTAEISGGQGPYRDTWKKWEDDEWVSLDYIIDPTINSNNISGEEIDYDVSEMNGFPYNILLPGTQGSYQLIIYNAAVSENECPPVVVEFQVYEADETLSWANIEIAGCEPNTGQCGGVATIVIDSLEVGDQLCQIAWFTCEGEPLLSSLISENMITDLCNGDYYAQLLYPENNDIDGDGTYSPGLDGVLGTEDDFCISSCNEDDPDIDGDGIDNDDDDDIDGDGILNPFDSFEEGTFEISTICFSYNDEGFEVIEDYIQDDLCNDENNEGNTIAIYTSGGSGGFTFTWFDSDGVEVSNMQNLENVEPGVYTLLTTENSGCEVWSEFTITTPEPITYVMLSQNNVPCADNAEDNICGGSIILNITGGMPFNDDDNNPYYQYTINNADYNISTIPADLEQNNETAGYIIDGLCTGNNTIDIIGQFDCVITFDVLMTGPDLFEVDYITTNVSCPKAEDGSIEIECSGGAPPYSYEWIFNENLYEEDQNINNLNGGVYTLYVTDDNDCIYSESVIIEEVPEFNIEVFESAPVCSSVIGHVSFNISGGYDGGYQYSILSATNSLIDSDVISDYNIMDSIPLIGGEYEFIFMDTEGCKSDTVFIDLTALSEDCLQVPSLFSPNGDSQNDVWQIEGIENYPDAKINIYNRWGQLVFHSNGNYFGNEWDGTHNGTPLPFAVYYYVIDPINENIKTYHGGVTIKR